MLQLEWWKRKFVIYSRWRRSEKRAWRHCDLEPLSSTFDLSPTSNLARFQTASTALTQTASVMTAASTCPKRRPTGYSNVAGRSSVSWAARTTTRRCCSATSCCRSTTAGFVCFTRELRSSDRLECCACQTLKKYSNHSNPGTPGYPRISPAKSVH